MHRWSERHGVTLELGVEAASSRQDHFVRLSVMERLGLVGGWFNVREARAEAAEAGSATLRLIGEGRALSWRWLREAEARRLFEQRLATLRTLGYHATMDAERPKGRWDWLQMLVQRRLVAPKAAPEPSSPVRVDLPSLLGELDPAVGTAALASVAKFLELPLSALLAPEAESIRGLPPEPLAVFLTFLMQHRDAEFRDLGARWLACPPTLYQLPTTTLVRWLECEPDLAPQLAPRVRREGLALLGPEPLERLSRHGHAAVRGPAKMWAQRTARSW